MRLNRALARSRNLCSIRVAQSIGVQAMLDRANALGLPDTLPPCACAQSRSRRSHAPGHDARIYGLRQRRKAGQTPSDQSIQGSWGNTIYRNPPESVQVISPRTPISWLVCSRAWYSTGRQAGRMFSNVLSAQNRNHKRRNRRLVFLPSLRIW